MATRIVTIEDFGKNKVGKHVFRVSWVDRFGDARSINYEEAIEFHLQYWRRKGWTVMHKKCKAPWLKPKRQTPQKRKSKSKTKPTPKRKARR